MRNFFRAVSLVVAVVLCMLCGLFAVSALGFDALLDDAGGVVSDSHEPMESEDFSEAVLDDSIEPDDSSELVPADLIEQNDSSEAVPDDLIEPDDFSEADPDDSMKPEGASGSLQSASVSGAGTLVEFQSNSLLAVPSGISNGSEAFPRSSSSDSDGNVQNALLALFGPYTPRMQTVTTYYNGEVVSTEEQVIPGVAGLDFEWLVSVGLFALMLWCLFRLLGGLLKHG